MEHPNLTQIKSAVQSLSPRERIALREFLDEFKDYEELDAVVQAFRAASPTTDGEEIMANVNIAVAESRNGKTIRGIKIVNVGDFLALFQERG